MAAEEGRNFSVDKSTAPTRDRAVAYDDAGGMSLVDFCVQLDDCTPTVSSGVIASTGRLKRF